MEEKSEQPKPKKRFYKRWWFWALVVIVLFIIIGASGSKNKQSASTAVATTNAPVQTAMPVTAAQLASDYQANEVAADAKYKGKVLDVTGSVDSINKDFLNDPYVILASDSDNILSNVECQFSQSDEGALANLSKGQQVTFQGTDSGMTLESVMLQSCTIVKQ